MSRKFPIGVATTYNVLVGTGSDSSLVMTMFPFSMSRSCASACARATAVIALLLGIAGCVSAPLSGGRPLPATAPPSHPSGATPPAPPVPAPMLPAPQILAPATQPDGGPGAAPNAVTTRPLAPSATPVAASDAIALVLPLESATYGPAAEAVKTGFLAAARRAGDVASRIRVIGHGDDGVLPAIEAAIQGGAALIVGPLTRDDLKTVIAMSPTHSRMLALNQMDDGSPLPGDTYALTLSIDSDAVQIARLARAEGARSAAVVASSGALQRRFAAAFDGEWRIGGQSPSSQYAFDP